MKLLTTLCCLALVAGCKGSPPPRVSTNQTCGQALTCRGNDHCCAPSSSDPGRETYFCAAASEVCP